MAELTIAQLTELLAANVDNADLLPIWDTTAAETKKITISNFRTAVGVTNWAESFSSATQATSRWIPSNAAANVNAAIVPKGTGAITAAIPDGTTAGGNARGTYAVDLQMQRTASNQVASSSYSVIGGGYRNSITGQFTTYSTIGGGDNNLVSAVNGNHVIGGGSGNQILNDNNEGNCVIGGGLDNQLRSGFSVIGGGRFNDTNTAPQYYQTIGGGYVNNTSSSGATIGGGQSNTASGGSSTIGGGQSNTASGQWSAVVGGQSNTASGGWATVGGGQSNTASGQWSTVSGGQGNSAGASYSSVIASYQGQADLYSQIVHSGGQFSSRGDAQAHELIWRRSITGTAQTELFLDGASVAAILPSTNSVWHGIIDITSICSVAGSGTTVLGDVAATSYKVTIKRIGTATTLVGTVQQIGTLNADASMSTAVFTIDNNDTNESLRLQFTPPTTAAANTVIRAVATFRGTQIKY